MKSGVICGIGFLVAVLITASLFTSCQSDAQIEFERYYSAGSLVYQTHCQNCHGSHGEGLMGLVPSLTDSIYLKANKSALACIVRYGLRGRIMIKNKVFEEKMPSNNLPPIEIANVLTYITNSFGNKSGTTTNQQVVNNLANCH